MLGVFHEQVCAPYERVVYSQYHGNNDEMNVFDEKNNTKFNETVEKLKEPSLLSYEDIDEYIDNEIREIDV